MSGRESTTIERPDTPPRASDRGRSRIGDLTRPIPIDRRIARRRRSTALLAVLALGIAAALAAAIFVLPLQTYFEQDTSLALRDGQLAELQSVNDDLRAEIARLQTDDGLKEAAREELGYVEAGERRQTILDLPPVPTALPSGWPYSLVTAVVTLRTAQSLAPPTSASITP